MIQEGEFCPRFVGQNLHATELATWKGQVPCQFPVLIFLVSQIEAFGYSRNPPITMQDFLSVVLQYLSLVKHNLWKKAI